MTDEMDTRIRRSAGRQSPAELAEEAIATAERAGDVADLRQRLAVEAGLPAELGARLKGDDAGALADDAKALAATLSELNPAPPASMDDQIRRAAGRDPSAAARPEPQPATSLDGGARQTSPAPAEPSLSSLIRAERDQKREERDARAAAYDDYENR